MFGAVWKLIISSIYCNFFKFFNQPVWMKSGRTYDHLSSVRVSDAAKFSKKSNSMERQGRVVGSRHGLILGPTFVSLSVSSSLLFRPPGGSTQVNWTFSFDLARALESSSLCFTPQNIVQPLECSTMELDFDSLVSIVPKSWNNSPNSLTCFSNLSFSSWLSMLANCMPW